MFDSPILWHQLPLVSANQRIAYPSHPSLKHVPKFHRCGPYDCTATRRCQASRATRLGFSKTASFGKRLIDLRRLGLFLQPEIRIRERAELVALFALLLDPCVVFLVVPALP